MARSLEEDLGSLETAGLLRVPPVEGVESSRLVDACSNDYLGLARRGVSRETLNALQAIPLGAGASRLIHGTHQPHLAAEHSLAGWLGTESALLFSSGYAANVGVLQALTGRGDHIISDELNHASIIDGCRLSSAEVTVVPHLQLEALQEALQTRADRHVVVLESYYSMDGRSPDLAAVRSLCDRHGALLVIDEAHALGVFGPQGRGLCAQYGVEPDVVVGTLGKSLGLHGAFVAASAMVRRILWNRARSLVFSTATSPWLASMVAPRVAEVAAADDLRERLTSNCQLLRAKLTDRVPVAAHSFGPIVPLITGTNEGALSLTQRLRQGGYRTQPIRPPTVPAETSRVRVTLNATFSSEQTEALAVAINDHPWPTR